MDHTRLSREAELRMPNEFQALEPELIYGAPTTEIESYLAQLEQELLQPSLRRRIELPPEWPLSFPDTAGLYLVWRDEQLIWVEETTNLRRRMAELFETTAHELRRRLAQRFFKDRSEFTRPSRARGLTGELEAELDGLLCRHFEVSALSVPLGRKEVQDRVEAAYEVLYTPGPVYSVLDLRKKYPNAYRSWSDEDDTRLTRLVAEGQSIDELTVHFGRRHGAIRARLEKLGLGVDIHTSYRK